MPADYVAVRNSCYNKVKKEKGHLSDKDKKACQKMAVRWWIKKHGKPFPKHGSYYNITDLDKISLAGIICVFPDCVDINTGNDDRFIIFNMDEAEKSGDESIAIKIDEPENDQYFRVRMRDPGQYNDFRTINIDKSKGIKAVIGIKGEGSDRKSEVQAYLFSKDTKYGWTKDKIKSWISEHQKSKAMWDSQDFLSIILENVGDADG